MSLLLHVIIQEGSSRFSTVVAIVMLCHETTDTGNGTVFPQASDFSIRFDAVIFERLHRDCLMDTLSLLGLGVNLLFTLLTTATKSQNKVQC